MFIANGLVLLFFFDPIPNQIALVFFLFNLRPKISANVLIIIIFSLSDSKFSPKKTYRVKDTKYIPVKDVRKTSLLASTAPNHSPITQKHKQTKQGKICAKKSLPPGYLKCMLQPLGKVKDQGRKRQTVRQMTTSP